MDAAEIMKRANAAYERSGLTLEEVGQRMGADAATSRQSAWQFLRKSTDPRISMLLRFCAALDISIEELLSEKAEKKKARSK